MKLKISAKELRAIGYSESPVIPVAMNVMRKISNIIQKKKQ